MIAVLLLAALIAVTTWTVTGHAQTRRTRKARR